MAPDRAISSNRGLIPQESGCGTRAQRQANRMGLFFRMSPPDPHPCRQLSSLTFAYDFCPQIQKTRFANPPNRQCFNTIAFFCWVISGLFPGLNRVVLGSGWVQLVDSGLFQVGPRPPHVVSPCPCSWVCQALLGTSIPGAIPVVNTFCHCAPAQRSP